MNCPSCMAGKPHPTHFNDQIICIACHGLSAARHNHVMCIRCEGGRAQQEEERSDMIFHDCPNCGGHEREEA